MGFSARRLLPLALLAAVACGDGTTEPVSVVGGTATLEADGRWRAEVRIDVDAAGAAVPMHELFGGTYTVSRDTVRLRDAGDGSIVVAVVRGARLTATVDGTTFDFDR